MKLLQRKGNYTEGEMVNRNLHLRTAAELEKMEKDISLTEDEKRTLRTAARLLTEDAEK